MIDRERQHNDALLAWPQGRRSTVSLDTLELLTFCTLNVLQSVCAAWLYT